YLTPVFWLSVQQTGSPLPLFSYGQQLERVAAKEAELAVDPRELDARRVLAQRAADIERKLADVPQAMADDREALAAQARALREADAPLARIQQAERRLATRPLTEEDARRAYERELEQASRHARPLAGMPPQSLPYAGTARAGTAAAGAGEDGGGAAPE